MRLGLWVQFEERADQVQIAGRAVVILPQVEKLGGEATGELFDDPGGGAIANPGVLQQVVPGFVGHENAELERAEISWVIDGLTISESDCRLIYST